MVKSVGQGKDKVRELLRQNPELSAKIEKEVREKMAGTIQDAKVIETLPPSVTGDGEGTPAKGKAKVDIDVEADDF